jgi:AcrR family transcriptional regulator
LAPKSRVTRETILETAAKLISDTGAASLTFQALGETLGVSKQAIIYWFPSKSDLARELIVPALQLEAEAVVAALRRVTVGRRAIEVFLRALIAFHLADLGRFRLIYVTGQFDTQIWQVAGLPELAQPIHTATSKMYGALESVLARAADFTDPAQARRTAVATHMAAVGALTMLSLADAVHDPMAHEPQTLIDSLVRLATGGALRPPKSKPTRNS